jgi:hypothetical protein
MTRGEFEAMMSADGWLPAQRHPWRNITPLCDVETFRREMARPDGMIESAATLAARTTVN